MTKLHTLLDALEALPQDKLIANEYFNAVGGCCVVGLAAMLAGPEVVELVHEEQLELNARNTLATITYMTRTQERLSAFYEVPPDADSIWQQLQDANDAGSYSGSFFRKSRVVEELRKILEEPAND
jgi:hypothetical protein